MVIVIFSILQKLVCILYLLHILIPTNHILVTRQSHVASVCHAGQQRSTRTGTQEEGCESRLRS